MIEAADKGDVAKVHTLIAQGTDVNHQNNYSQTALIKAAGQGHLAVVKFLLTQGAEVNHQTQFGETALMLASYEGHPAVVRLLLAQGAQVNLTSDDGITTALSIAKTKEVAQLLKAAGAKCSAKWAIGKYCRREK